MKDTKILEKVGFELCSVPDSEGLTLELSDEKFQDSPFLEIRVDDNDVRWVRFFSSDTHIAMTLEAMEEAIELAKKKVFNVSMDM